MRLRDCLVLSALVVLLMLASATSVEAQLVRRTLGGGIQVDAPLVRVNVGPPAVATPHTTLRVGGGLLGRRLQLRNQAAANANNRRRMNLTPSEPVEEKEPTLADVDELPYPTADQLHGMNDAQLVESLREMMGRLNYRLSLFNTGDGWQNYLVLTREDLGAPGSGPKTPKFETVQQVLPHFEDVSEDSQYVKIHTLPSFQAAHAALTEVERRFGKIAPNEPAATEVAKLAPKTPASGPELISAAEAEPPSTVVRAPQRRRMLPTPQPASARGERSILKRK